MPSVVTFDIPADILESARLSVPAAKLELAIALFVQDRLSMGKAAELASLPVSEFMLHLSSRNIGPHYDAADAIEDSSLLAASRSS